MKANDSGNGNKWTKRKHILRILTLALCAVILFSLSAIPIIDKADNGISPSSNKAPTAYAKKQKLMETTASIAMLVPSDMPPYAEKLKKKLGKYGMKVDVFTWQEAEQEPGAVFDTWKYSALIYTEATGIPSGLIPMVTFYTNNMGGLICIGGPAFRDVYERKDGNYVKVRTMRGAMNTEKKTAEKGEIVLDCLCPMYQTFPITNAVKLVSGSDQGILPETEYKIPSDLFSPSPRNNTAGILNDRKRRFIPLIEAIDEKGEIAGYPGYILMTQAGGDTEYNPGIWASFNSNDPDFLGSAPVVSAIACTAAYFDLRTFLYGGGAGEYTYFPGDEWEIGAETLSRNVMFGYPDASTKGKDIGYKIKLSVFSKDKKVYEKTFEPYDFEDSYPTPLGELSLYHEKWTPPENGKYTITTELYGSGVLMDKLIQPVRIYEEKPPEEREFVTRKGNDLYLDGKVWKCYGVNYMPSSGITLLGNNYEKWVSASAFDIDVVSKDLRRIKDIGLNAVSIFAYYDRCMDNNNLITLVELCRENDLKAFFSIRLAEPMTYTDEKFEMIREMLKKNRLIGNDTIIGYDIAWETMPNGYDPSWCNRVGMGAFDKEWDKWVKDNYGSVEAAEAAWEWNLERNPDGTAKGVNTNVRSHHGVKASKAIIAYDRWIQDWTADIYGRVVDDLKSIDPEHLIGARNGMYTGWPNKRLGNVGWEYGALASALDFMGPEGYGYYEKWNDDFETAVYSVAYSRYSCERPVIWLEFGKTSWNGTNYDNTDAIEEQAEYYRNIRRVMTDSQSNGVFFWWYAGGYRMGEASDYGIINPDGSDRTTTKILREYAKEFKKGGVVKEPEYKVTPKRPEYTFGVRDMYNEQKSDFRAAQAKGETFGIINEAVKKTSLDTDLSRISDLPIGPLRNLNACLRKVRYRTDGGEWKLLSDGETITAKKNSSIEFKVTAVNNGNARWICRGNAGSSAGAVCVNADGVSFDTPSDVARHDLVTVEGIKVKAESRRGATIQMSAEGRSRFGEKITFNIRTV